MSFGKQALLSATAMLAVSLTLAGCGEEKKEEQAAAPAAAEPAQPAASKAVALKSACFRKLMFLPFT